MASSAGPNISFSSSSHGSGSGSIHRDDDDKTLLSSQIRELQEQIDFQAESFKEQLEELKFQAESSKNQIEELKFQAESSKNQIEELNKNLDKLSAELDGIRRVFQPAVVFALMETSVRQCMKLRGVDEEYLQDNQHPTCLFASSILHASFKTSRSVNGGNNQASVESLWKLSRGKTAAFCKDAMSGLILFLLVLPKGKSTLSSWPPDRNVVVHNGPSLKALYPSIEADEFATSDSIKKFEKSQIGEYVAAITKTKNVKKGLTRKGLFERYKKCLHTKFEHIMSDQTSNDILDVLNAVGASKGNSRRRGNNRKRQQS